MKINPDRFTIPEPPDRFLILSKPGDSCFGLVLYQVKSLKISSAMSVMEFNSFNSSSIELTKEGFQMLNSAQPEILYINRTSLNRINYNISSSPV